MRMVGKCDLEAISTFKSSIESVRVIVSSHYLKSKPSKAVIFPNDFI